MIKRVLRYVVSNNSLYLFSGLCMLYGCYLLMGDKPAGERSILPDLALLGTMKFYEILVTIFACVVLKRVRVEADGILLAMMAVVLYLDPTLFNTRFHSAGRMTGLLVNGGCLAIGLIGMRVLISFAGVPISKAGFRGVGIGAGLIYLSASVLDPDFTGAKNGNSFTQDHLYWLLWMTTLVAAIVARPWMEADRRAESTPQTIQVNGQEYDGRAIRVDRYRYLDVVLTFLPFVLLVRHLWLLQPVYEVKMYAANIAPVILGVALFADRTFSGLRTSAPLLFVGLGWVAVLASGEAAPEAMVMVGAIKLTPIHLIAILNIGAGLFLFERTGSRVYLYNSVLLGVPLFSGSADLLDSAINLRPAFLVPLWIASLLVALRNRSFTDVLVAGWMTLLVGVRTAGLDAPTSIGIWSHGAAWWMLFTGYRYGIASVKQSTPELATFLLFTSFAALHGMQRPPSVLLMYFAGSTAFFLVLGTRRHDSSTRNVAMGFGGTELGLQSWTRVQHIDFAALAKSFGGVGMMVLAFGGLFLGLWVSINKDRLLSWLADDAAPRS